MNYKKVIDFTQFQVSNYESWEAIECGHSAVNKYAELATFPAKAAQQRAPMLNQQKAIWSVIRIFWQ